MHGRPVGFGQVDVPALHQPPGEVDAGPAARSTANWSATATPAPSSTRCSPRDRRQAAPRDRHGVPALQPLPAHDGAGERHRGADPGQGRQARPRRWRGREDLLDQVGLADKARRLPGAAVRRPAAARRDRPGAGHEPEAHAVRRAHLGAGPRAGRRGPRRDERARRGGHDDGGRHPRDGLRPRGRRPAGVHGRRRRRRERATHAKCSTNPQHERTKAFLSKVL